MTIGVIALRRPASRPNPILPEMIGLLRDWGWHVQVLLPDEQPIDLAELRPAHDLYLLKSAAPAALSLAAALHAQNAWILNPYPVTALCRDKAAVSTVLRVAGLPLPRTWMTTRPALLAEQLEDGPLVVKPADGAEG